MLSLKMHYLKNRLNRNFFLLISIDTLIISISIYLSILFRFDFSIPAVFLAFLTLNNFIILIIIKIFCFRVFALYRGMWRYTSIWDLMNIIKSNILSTLFLICIVYYFYGFRNFSRSIFAIDLIICTGLISMSRLGIRVFFNNIKDLLSVKKTDTKTKNIILIGAGDTGQLILRQVLQRQDSSMDIVGIIDDDFSKIGSRLHGVPVLGNVESLSELNFDYDEIYICIPSASKEQMRSIIDKCKETNKPFKTLPSISEMIDGDISISHFREVSLLDLLGREEITLNKKSVNKFIKGKRVLVTGAGGSIGSELVKQCIKFSPSVLIMMDISELNLFEIDRVLKSGEKNILFKPILADIRDISIIDKVFKEFRPQIVFHAAAYKHVPMQEIFPWEAIKTNVFGTNNLSKIAVKHEVEKFVLVSTDKAVKPTNVMGATKRLAEIITQNYNHHQLNTQFMSVRFGNVLGSSGSVIPIFQEQIKNGGPVTITDPEMERYFMSIPEASQLILQAGALGLGEEVFILDMGSPIKIIDIAIELIRLSGFEPDDGISIKYTGARPGEKKIEELSLPNEKLDKTSHDKIFILRKNNKNEKMIEKVIQGVKILKNDLIGKNPNEVRILLSSILPEYKPNQQSTNKLYPSKDKEKAEA
jgi:FlaA1/EpsC-like NDP-sugar epimerase